MDWALEHVTQEWGAFVSAPALCLSFLVLGGLLVWWVNRRETSGLRAEKLTMEQRLSLAQEQERVASKNASETRSAISVLSKQVANQAPLIEIAATVASVGVSIDELMRAQCRVSETIQTSSGSGAAIIRPDDL